ncbi:DUF2750 domain-containing protein [Pseudomonadota bacterium]
MTEQLTPEQIDAIANLSAEERYEDFISRIIEEEKIWSLSSEEGWAVISDDGEEYLPTWPIPEMAANWATDGYSDCEPKFIALQDWLEKWLPGMIDDNLQIAVCPDIQGEGVVVSAEELLSDIQDAMA